MSSRHERLTVGSEDGVRDRSPVTDAADPPARGDFEDTCLPRDRGDQCVPPVGGDLDGGHGSTAARKDSGRAKCKNCGELMDKGSLRVVLGREIEFGNQYRTMPIQVHARCVSSEIEKEDCSTEADGFEAAIRANSRDLNPEQVETILREVGRLPESEAPPF